ncbi:hypothetical protein NECAME_17390 [Necator americanus]|uniref:Uncharacterized protein n=1 Tax=Necator americanus TaxID=51031 RepID=W2TNI0_NECAM|nr:hypothetical protein NECAME_17390 [Necator americanus]ETN83660.1 hypothetical protein NECAME_17390 [Necator americanus]
MEKEVEEEEVFEIDDFTVITEFERFVVAIEALVQEWGLIGARPRKKYPKASRILKVITGSSAFA